MQELQGSRLSEQKQKRHFSAGFSERLSTGNAGFLFNKADAENWNLYSQQIHRLAIFFCYVSGIPFSIGPRGSAHTTSRTQWIKNGFFWKLNVTWGPSQRRSSQLLSRSCGPLITVQRSRRAARKMLIYQDVERWGLHRWEQESYDQSEASWDGALNTCVADYSHNPTFLLQRASKCWHGTRSLQRKRVSFHLRFSDLYQPSTFHPQRSFHLQSRGIRLLYGNICTSKLHAGQH